MASARTSDLAFVNFLLSIIRCLVSRTNDDHMANITVNVMNPNREKLNFFSLAWALLTGCRGILRLGKMQNDADQAVVLVAPFD